MFRARIGVALAALLALGAEPARPRLDAYGDPLPPHALARLGTLRFRHVDAVQSVAFTPDGRQILSLGGAARLWEAATGRPLQTLSFVPGYGTVALAPDGKALALIGDDPSGKFPPSAVLRLADFPGGKERWRRAVPRAVDDGTRSTIVFPLYFLSFSADGRLLALGGTTCPPRLMDRTGRERLVLRAAPKPGKRRHLATVAPDGVTAVALAPDGRWVAVACGDMTVRLWDVGGGKELHALEGHTEAVRALAFTPDGKGLLSGGDDGTLRLWDVRTGRELRRFEGHRAAVWGVAVAPDGKTVASVAPEEAGLRLWDFATGKERHRLEGTRARLGQVLSIALSPDGQTLASGGRDQTVRLWDVATGKERLTFAGNEFPLKGVAFAPDGRTLATSSNDGVVRLWETSTGKEAARLRNPAGGAEGLVYSPDGKALASVGGGGNVYLWRLGDRQLLWEHQSQAYMVRALAFAPDGRTLAEEGPRGTAWVLEAATGKPLRQLAGHESRAFFLRYTPDGRTLISGGDGRTVLFLDPDTGQERRVLRGRNSRLDCLELSPDGRTLAALEAGRRRLVVRGAPGAEIHEWVGRDEDWRLALWEVATGKEVLRLDVPRHEAVGLAFAPDGRTLAVGTLGGPVVLRDALSGRELTRLEGHGGHVFSLAFAPDGRTLASGSVDTTALLWDVRPWAGRRGGAAPLSPRDLDAHWAALAGEDAPRAWRAVGALVAAGEQAVPLVEKNLRAARPDRQRLARLIAALDSADFEMREQATRELARLGEAAEPALRGALKAGPSAEVRRRIGRLLEPLRNQELTGERLREVRAAQVLELTGTAAARRVLAALAKGEPEARLTREARDALQRLAARPAQAP
jgi:WD40 repeat protein